LSWAKNKRSVYGEVTVRYALHSGDVTTATFRDAVVPEHSYMALMHAHLRSLRSGTPYRGERVSRTIKDVLIRTNLQI